MKKIILLSLALLSQAAFSQVHIEKNKLVKDGKTYKMSKYNEVFQNSDAKDYFKKSRTNNTVGSILAYTGGFGIGFGIGRIIANGKETKVQIPYYGTLTTKPDNGGAWAAIGIGAGLIGIGIPFAIAAKKNANKAIAIENGESTAFVPYFKLESAGNGMSLSYNF